MTDAPENSLDALLEEYVNRLRRGERPAIDEFIVRAPEHADEIHDLFPALRIMEQVGPGTDGIDLGATGLDSTVVTPMSVGDYRIIREVGRGGMGIVYEAEQVSLGRHVALKVLPDRIASNTKNLLRFRREARSAGRLHHTNIVPVFDIGCDAGVHYYAMQFIQGNSLDAVISELARRRRDVTAAEETSQIPDLGRQLSGQIARDLVTRAPANEGVEGINSAGRVLLPGDDAQSTADQGQRAASAHFLRSTPPYFHNVARIGMQVADALAYAHAHRILHRDVKPSNLLLDVYGNVWVTDFGLAKDEDDSLTRTGDVVGTLKYIAPERFRAPADARSDIYSLGLTLYELVTLRSCHLDADGRTRVLPDSRNLEAPRKVDSLVPKDLETIILKAVAHEPQLRYDSAESMADDLRRFLSDRPILARRMTPFEHGWLWCRRNPFLTTAIATATVLLIISCFGMVASHILRSQRDSAIRAERSALVHEHLAKATSHCISGRPAARGRALAEIRQAVLSEPTPPLRASLRDEAILALAMTDVRIESLPLAERLPVEILGSPQDTGVSPILAVSPNYRHVAVLVPGGQAVAVYDLSTRRVLCQIPTPSGNIDASFNRTGDVLVVTGQFSGSFVTIWDATTGHSLYQADEWYGLDINPEGRLVAIGRSDRTVLCVALHDPSANQVIDVGQVPEGVAWSPDGSRLAVCYLDQAPGVQIFDVDQAKCIATLNCGETRSVHWHPQLDRLAISRSGYAEIWDVAKRTILATTINHRHIVSDCRFSRDGELLLSTCWDGTCRLWDVNTMRQLLTLDQSIDVGWSDDNATMGWLADQDTLRLFHLERSSFLRTMPSSRLPGEILLVGDFSEDGRFAVTVCGDTWAQYGRVLDVCHVADQRLLGSAAFHEISAVRCGQSPPALHVIHGHQWTQLPMREAARATVHAGPSETARLSAMPVRSAFSVDGMTCATITSTHLYVSVRDRLDDLGVVPRTIATFALRRGHDYLALSPDGNWVTTGQWHSPVVCVWNITRQCLAGELRVGTQTRSYFSPASDQVITARSDAYRFWELPTLESGMTLLRSDCPQPDPIAIDPTGRLAVLSLRPGELNLVRLKDGQMLARLRRPERDRSRFLAFSPDGTRVLTGSAVDHGIDLWDLPALQRELTEFNLAMAIDDLPRPDDLIQGECRQLTGLAACAETEFIGLMTEADARRRLELQEQRYQEDPASSVAANNLSWDLSFAPELLRNTERAIELAEQALQVNPGSTTVRNTLAAACYRAGQYERAITLLESNAGVTDSEKLPWDLFLLSLCHAALGNEPRAHLYLDLGQRWMQIRMEEQAPVPFAVRPELEFLRDEAARRLRLP
ncbi:MAG: protein kinase [Planctomycetales bacterium]|nr:protein kinase [Planctomycetales bacterium]